jgi:nitroreductase
MTASFDDVAALIRGRRTNLSMDLDRPVPDDLVASICDLVHWAPNHKRTWPWEVAWLTGEARRRLGEVAAEAMQTRGDDPAKVAKTRTKYLRAPGMIVVGAQTGDSPLRTAENRDAAAAGVQNLLLGATAAGLASFWSSCPKGANDVVAELCGFTTGTTVVALVYLGWPLREAEVPERTPLDLHVLTD